MEIKTREMYNNNALRILLDAFFQAVKRFFVLAFDDTDNGVIKVDRDIHQKYFLLRVKITNYNVLIDGRNFYDQPTGDHIKKKEDSE